MPYSLLAGVMIVSLWLVGCATTQPQEPQIKRISAEELERVMPKPVPNLSLDEVVALSKAGTPADVIIEKIKASNSRYDLSPSEAVDLSKRGVDSKVLDYIYQAREQALRDGFADEINKREKEKLVEQEKLKRQYQLDNMRYYDPWGPWGPRPYGGWYRPYGPSFNYRWGW
jgi:hypothetical protein